MDCFKNFTFMYNLQRRVFGNGPITSCLNAVFRITPEHELIRAQIPDAPFRFVCLLSGLDWSSDGTDQQSLNDRAKELRGYGETHWYLDVFNDNRALALKFRERWAEQPATAEKIANRTPGIWEAYALWEENEALIKNKATSKEVNAPTISLHVQQVYNRYVYGDMDKAMPCDYPIVTKHSNVGGNFSFPLFALSSPNDPYMKEKLFRKAILAIGFINVFSVLNRSPWKLWQLQFGLMEPLLGLSLCGRLDQVAHGRPPNKYNYGGKMDHFLWSLVWLSCQDTITNNIIDFVLIFLLNFALLFLAYLARPLSNIAQKERLGWDYRKGKDRRKFFERFNQKLIEHEYFGRKEAAKLGFKYPEFQAYEL